MKNILVITASIFGQDGQSSRLVDQTLDQLRQSYGDIQTSYRDLSAEPVPHLDAERFGAFLTARTTATARSKALSIIQIC